MKKLPKIILSLIVLLAFINGCGSTRKDSTESNTTQSSQGELDVPLVPPSVPHVTVLDTSLTFSQIKD